MSDQERPRKSSRGQQPRSQRERTPEEEDINSYSSPSSDTEPEDQSPYTSFSSDVDVDHASEDITVDSEESTTDSYNSGISDSGSDQEAGPQESEPQEAEPQEVEPPEGAGQAGPSSAARLDSTPPSAAERDAPQGQTSTRILWVFPPEEGTDEPIEIVLTDDEEDVLDKMDDVL